MPTRPDKDTERFARIEALIEEYRVKHEDLEACIRWIREQVQRGRTKSRRALANAHRFKRDGKNR